MGENFHDVKNTIPGTTGHFYRDLAVNEGSPSLNLRLLTDADTRAIWWNSRKERFWRLYRPEFNSQIHYFPGV